MALASWQALRDAVQGSNQGGADTLTEATNAAERLETTLDDAGRAAKGAGTAVGAAAAEEDDKVIEEKHKDEQWDGSDRHILPLV